MRVPFYCDPIRIGTFAIEPDELATGTDAALFRLFVTLSMYQALRDVVIMRQQRSLPRSSMRAVADVATLKRSIARHACPTLLSVEAFEHGCDVVKDGDDIDCDTCPGAALPRQGRDARLQPHGRHGQAADLGVGPALAGRWDAGAARRGLP